MEQRVSKKRPWLAAVLGVVATGLGHLYLRRWLRAGGWLGIATLTTILFVPDSTVTALAAGEQVSWMNFIPVLLVSVASVFDAYQLAVMNNHLYRARSRGGENDSRLCSSCGRQVDNDLDFCQWCSTPLAESVTDTDSERPHQT